MKVLVHEPTGAELSYELGPQDQLSLLAQRIRDDTGVPEECIIILVRNQSDDIDCALVLTK